MNEMILTAFLLLSAVFLTDRILIKVPDHPALILFTLSLFLFNKGMKRSASDSLKKDTDMNTSAALTISDGFLIYRCNIMKRLDHHSDIIQVFLKQIFRCVILRIPDFLQCAAEYLLQYVRNISFMAVIIRSQLYRNY